MISLAPETEELNIYLSPTNKITMTKSERKLMQINPSRKHVKLECNLFMVFRFFLSILPLPFGFLPMLEFLCLQSIDIPV